MSDPEQFRKDFHTLQEQNLQLVSLIQAFEKEKVELNQRYQAVQEHNLHCKQDIETYREQQATWQRAQNESHEELKVLKAEKEDLQAQITAFEDLLASATGSEDEDSDQDEAFDDLQEKFEELTFQFNDLNEQNVRLRQNLENPTPAEHLDMAGQQDLQNAEYRIEELEESQEDLQALVEKLTAENLAFEKQEHAPDNSALLEEQKQALTEWQEAYNQLQSELQHSLESESILKQSLERSVKEKETLLQQKPKEDSQVNALRDENSQLLQDKIFLEQENENAVLQAKKSQAELQEVKKKLEELSEELAKAKSTPKEEPQLLLKKSLEEESSSKLLLVSGNKEKANSDQEAQDLLKSAQKQAQESQEQVKAALSQIASLQESNEELIYQNERFNEQAKRQEKQDSHAKKKKSLQGKLINVAIAIVSLTIGVALAGKLMNSAPETPIAEAKKTLDIAPLGETLEIPQEWPPFENEALTSQAHNQHFDISFKQALFKEKRQLHSGQGRNLSLGTRAIGEVFKGYQVEVISLAIGDEKATSSWPFLRASQVQIALMRAGIPATDISNRLASSEEEVQFEAQSVVLRIKPKS